MPGRLSDADTNDVLDSRFGAGAAGATNAPGSYWAGLSSTQPDNTGGNITEPVGGGYARIEVVNDAVNFPAAAARSKANGVDWQFPIATDAWGALGWFVLMDAEVGGAMRAWGPLSLPVTVQVTQAPLFPAGACVISGPGSS